MGSLVGLTFLQGMGGRVDFEGRRETFEGARWGGPDEEEDSCRTNLDYIPHRNSEKGLFSGELSLQDLLSS